VLAGFPESRSKNKRRCAAVPGLFVHCAFRHLRETALATYQLNTRFCGTDYTYLAEGRNSRQADGEVQIFSDYRQRLNDAALARRETVPLIDNV
jgi:hypothetical protein